MIVSREGFILATPTKCGTTSLEGVAKRHMRRCEGSADGDWEDRWDLFRLMDWDSPRRQHRMALPPGEGGPAVGAKGWGWADRWLLVRNPYTRYVSMYRYLRAPQNYSQWGAKQVQGRNWEGGEHGEVRIQNAREQGEEWPDRDPMTFEEFLWFLAEVRTGPLGTHALERGDMFSGGAYRSPWVWTDSLWDSLRFFEAQPGNEHVELVQLENLWGPGGDLAVMLGAYGIPVGDDGVDIRELHSNRGVGESSLEPWAPSWWRHWWGWACDACMDGFESSWGTNAGGPTGCAACAVGVRFEAHELGYI